MSASGGRRITRTACCVALALLAASCTGGSSTKKAADTPAGAGDTSSGGGPVTSGGGVGGSALSLGQASAAATGGGAGSGLSVRGTASATVAADQAFVVVVPSPRNGIDLIGGSGVAPADRTTVLNALAASGVAKADVAFDPDPRTGQPRVQVKLAIQQLASKGPGVVTAIERTLGRSLSSGVAFSLASCDPASGPLRKQALQQADGEAKALADAAKMGLGAIVAVRQATETGLLALRSPAAAPGCPLVASGQLDGFDAKPEVKLTVAVDVTYAIAGAPAPGPQARPLVWSLGSATARSKADEAYVVVLFGSDSSDPSAGPSAADRNRVFDALGKLKIDRKDVTVSSGSDYGVTTIVQVETKSAGLATGGKDVVRAVEDVLGHSDSSGARFWSSTCNTLLTKARKDAVADGRRRATALADAAGVKVGDLQSVSELSITGIDPCDASVDAVLGSSDYGSPSLQSFDAEPEFTLTTATQLAFAIAG